LEASALSHPAALGRFVGPAPLLRLRSDDQLVALFRAGHDEAFGVIHDRYRQRLLAYARQMLGGSRSDAEDVLQDVFLRAYHALRVDARPVTLRAWLYRVAHNRCIDQLRRPTPAAADIFDLNRAPQQDPLDAAERREDFRRLIEDVRRLPEQQRSALLMREMEGLSYNELADALGVTVPAIKSLLVRARIGLVEAIEARDTACKEIRVDVASAFDRGVRVSGRSRRHLRECAGCREYRGALRGIEKQLNGLSPGAGPLTTLAKILGIGGAGSGAAAGGGAAVGGGGGAAVMAGGTASTVGAGVATISAGKVAAVVAAAAVVGGGAATVEQTVEHYRPATKAAVSAPATHTRVVAGAAPAAAAHRDPLLQMRRAAAAPAVHHPKTAAVAPSVAELTADPPFTSTPAHDAPAYEPTTGGLQAPDEPATEPGTTTPGTGAATGTGTATPNGGSPSAGTISGSAGTAAAPGGAGSAPASGTSGPSGAPAAGTTGAAPAPANAPSGQVTTGSSGAPMAQGASAAPAG
jgi:RNA polymerase sigma factor (sigma-70 family)